MEGLVYLSVRHLVVFPSSSVLATFNQNEESN